MHNNKNSTENQSKKIEVKMEETDHKNGEERKHGGNLV